MNEMREFQKSFTEDQKAAIIACLLIIASCDSPANQKEMNSIQTSAKTLGMELNQNPTFLFMLELAKEGNTVAINDKVIRLLNTLERNQKEWFILAMHTLMHVDGNVVQQEVLLCLNTAQKIGISPDEYKNILDKMDKLYDAFF